MRSPLTPIRVVALAALALVAGVALGQQLTSRSLGGSETWQVGLGGPGGTSQFVTSAQFRNSQGVTNTAATTGTLTFTTSTASVVWTAASGGAQTINLPPLPFDGEIFEIINGTAGAFTTGSVVATTDGSTVDVTAIGALAAHSSLEWRFVLATNTWYKMR